QSGSLVDNDKLRFDFSHFESISRIVLDEIEKEVNDVILSNIPVIIGYENIQTAKDRGAMALFSDKYGDVVRVVEMPGFSIELCGGTHVEFTGEIGLFNVESEGGISSGIRRIVATTGRRSLNYVNDIEEKLSIISSMLKTDENNVVDVVKKYIIESKEILKEKDYLQNKLLKYEMETIFDDVIEISGTKVLIKDFLSKEIDELKEIVDRGKEKLKSGIVVLGSNNGGKAVFIAGVTKDLIGKLKAGDIVKITAQMAGGNGGGRPDFAQAGGKDGSVVKEALLKAKEYIIENLN
ncbi:MAG: alanine--tRNA ligase, partial [Leptotrichiaceae bacterium]|nr:alanine--tRNA ligase [Leptotrichiaceae bacterium]